MQTNTTNIAETNNIAETTPQTLVEYDFENDDDSFYDLIEFGISSNRGRLCINGVYLEP